MVFTLLSVQYLHIYNLYYIYNNSLLGMPLGSYLSSILFGLYLDATLWNFHYSIFAYF